MRSAARGRCRPRFTSRRPDASHAPSGRGGRGGGPEQEEEHARPEGAWEASGRRDVKRGGAKGSSHLPSEVLPLAVAEEEEGAENSTHR